MRKYKNIKTGFHVNDKKFITVHSFKITDKAIKRLTMDYIDCRRCKYYIEPKDFEDAERQGVAWSECRAKARILYIAGIFAEPAERVCQWYRDKDVVYEFAETFDDITRIYEKGE